MWEHGVYELTHFCFHFIDNLLGSRHTKREAQKRSMHAAFMYLVTWVFSFLDFQLIDTANTYVTYGFVYLVLWNVYRRNI